MAEQWLEKATINISADWKSYGLPRPVSNMAGSFQKRYVKKGMGLILKESIRINGDNISDDKDYFF